ncbi:MAG: glycoside hydrolase family 127 protein [Candidatus Cryptobacteroides sp.]
MKHNHLLPILAFSAALSAALSCSKAPQAEKAIQPVLFSEVTIDDSFWSPRLNSLKDVTLGVCIDQIENQTGRIRNFENAAKGEGQHSGIYFDDSDVYKALEGMAYSLKNNPDSVLEAKCDEWIDKFAAAQQPDGYINTYYTLTGLENRWTDMGMHEMYCAGHLLEAAIAYYEVTGKSTLLDVATGMVAHIMDTFGPDKRHWVPGHEEIELALVKLYSLTGEKKYLDFAQWLIEERGHGYGNFNDYSVVHFQDDIPVREMSTINGHAVRAMYLFCGMADIAAYTGDQDYINVMNTVWDKIVERKMYVTGGIGHIGHAEGFSADFDLPNAEAYCETCASIGMVLWNWRMNGMTGDAKFIDVMERSLYNGVLSGISLSGDRFFYVNPLESDGNHHRQAWYGCACCPSNLCRFIPSVGNYIYGTSKDAVLVNLFVGSSTTAEGLGICQETSYPWSGDVKICVSARKPLTRTLKIRIPGWCESWTASVGGETVDPAGAVIDKGYLCIDRKWEGNTEICISFEMPARLVSADPRVKADEGKKALMRGPLVYCLEGIDNAETYWNARFDSGTTFAIEYDATLLGGISTISAATSTGDLHFVPYYSWDNREACPMKVWVDCD